MEREMASPMPIPFSLVDTNASNVLSTPSSGSLRPLSINSVSTRRPSNTQERLPVDVLHRVDRVGDQIDDDLLDLISIHENLKNRASNSYSIGVDRRLASSFKSPITSPRSYTMLNEALTEGCCLYRERILRNAASVTRPCRTTRSIEVIAFSMFGVGAFGHRKHACAFESNDDNG
jgi:hypothetical protein